MLQARPSVSNFPSWCSIGDPIRFFPKCQISTSVFGFDVGLPRLLVKVTAPIIHLWPQLASPGGGALSLMILRVVYAVSGRNLTAWNFCQITARHHFLRSCRAFIYVLQLASEVCLPKEKTRGGGVSLHSGELSRFQVFGSGVFTRIRLFNLPSCPQEHMQ